MLTLVVLISWRIHHTGSPTEMFTCCLLTLTNLPLITTKKEVAGNILFSSILSLTISYFLGFRWRIVCDPLNSWYLRYNSWLDLVSLKALKLNFCLVSLNPCYKMIHNCLGRVSGCPSAFYFEWFWNDCRKQARGSY